MNVTIDQIYWKERKAKITIHNIFNATHENYNISSINSQYQGGSPQIWYF